LFNQPTPSRSAKPWQPNARLVSDDTGRGFATTQWTQQEGAGFAEGGFKPHATGFSADRYQTVSMALSEKSRTTLRLMGETDGVDDFAADAVKRTEPESPNAHLPFVMDVYGVKPAAKKATALLPEHGTAQSTEALDAEAQAEAEAEEASADADDPEASDTPQTVDAAAGNADVTNSEAADGPSEEEALQSQAVEDAVSESEAAAAQDQDQAQDETADEAQALEAQTEAEQEQASEAEPDLAESELVSDDHSGEPQALAVEIEDVLAQEPVPPAAPVVIGIDPDEVAQREAEQFAQGLAQGLEEGERKAREAMQQEVAAQCAVLSAVSHDLNALLQDPKKFFEPLKRLALHVAEHVVMKELSTSTEAIERLVQRCLDELDHPAKGAVVVELNPQDKERLQAQDSALVAGMRLDAVKGMKPGSVRLFANDTVVEDLVEHRLEALARSLMVDVEDWRAKSALAQPEAVAPESESESEVQDVEPKDVHS
jgi:flagellar biosynthesis/type III secretory pathway protein FliH